MKTFSFYEYLPKRYAERSVLDAQVRNLVFRFKDGDKEAAAHAAECVARLLVRWYQLKCKEYTLVCVPSSSMATYKRRFSYFSAIVARRCRQESAMSHINIIGERQALHRTADHVVRECEGYYVNIDSDFFRGRKVIVFDDLITSGKSAEHFSQMLSEAGAEVVGGLFLARTTKGIKLTSPDGRWLQAHTDITEKHRITNYKVRREVL